MEEIGSRIIFLRESLGKTQVHLAKEIGISKMTLSKYEHNVSAPRGEIIAKIADALDTTTDYLLGRSQSPNLDLRTGNWVRVSRTERELLYKFCRLTRENRIRIQERVDALLEQQQIKEQQKMANSFDLKEKIE